MISIIVRILISSGFLGLLYFMMKDQLPAILETLSSAHLLPLSQGFLILCLGTILMGWRLRLIFLARGDKLKWSDGVNVTYVGLFFNNFFPTSVGGDVMKAYCVSQKIGSKMRAFSGVLMDRILALFMFVTLPGITVLFILDQLQPAIPYTVIGVFVMAGSGLLLIYFKDRLHFLKCIKPLVLKVPAGKRVLELVHELHSITQNRMIAFRVCAVAIVGQVLNIMCVYMIIVSLGQSVEFWYLLLIVPVIHLFSMLPSINGLGLRETGFVYFLHQRMGDETAASVAILYLLYMVSLSLIGGVIYATRQDYHFDLKQLKKAA